MTDHYDRMSEDEPSADDLAEIERESGLIAAEMALLDAEIRILSAEDEPSEIDWQRLRRAMRDVLRESAKFHAEGASDEDAEDSPEEAA